MCVCVSLSLSLFIHICMIYIFKKEQGDDRPQRERAMWIEKEWGKREGKRERRLLSSAAPICSESAGGALFTQLCMCVLRGGQEERKGNEKEGGSGGMKGQGGAVAARGWRV